MTRQQLAVVSVPYRCRVLFDPHAVKNVHLLFGEDLLEIIVLDLVKFHLWVSCLEDGLGDKVTKLVKSRPLGL